MKIMFEVDTEKDEMGLANYMMKAQELVTTLSEVRELIFRPARKHGYNQPDIEGLLEKCGDAGYELIDKLEDLYNEILNDNGLSGLV